MLPEAWRIALSRHLRRDIRERLLADQFRSGTNWSRTAAFASPAAYTSFLRVNLRDREPQGTVEPGWEYHSLLDRLEADLKQLTDPETEEPAVKGIARTVEAFRCDAPVSLPDLFVEWKPGRFMERVTHPRVELVQRKPDFFRVSDHSRYGFVAAAGPSIRGCGDLADVSLLDLAPTFLFLMDEPCERMAGRVIDRMVSG
jgi:predicted AlkP superfamily phosphohydrolase/phosphomutase